MEKVLIVTNQKLMFAIATFIIGKHFPTLQTATASRQCDVLASLKHENFAFVIFDTNTLEFNSLELFLMLSGKTKATRVLMVNVRAEDKIVFEMHRLGVKGMLSNKADENECMKAITAMLEGGNHISPDLAEKLFFYGIPNTEVAKHNTLTARETQVMLMLGNGKGIKEIADQIYLSEKTISTYKSRVYRKMGFSNDAQLVAYLLKHSYL